MGEGIPLWRNENGLSNQGGGRQGRPEHAVRICSWFPGAGTSKADRQDSPHIAIVLDVHLLCLSSLHGTV